ncbi:MAG: hypothetical protein ABSG78_01260 [Verrucomicrobiota bacterium]|jgi:hypothetical protein
MKITITAAGGTAFVLADDAGGATVQDGFRPKQTRILQRQRLFRSGYKTNIPRYNLENRLRFVVERTFGTVELCLNFMAQHADSVPAQGNLVLYNRSGTGQATRTLGNAVVAEVECVEHVGVSCKFQYTIAGNGAWQ